MKMESKIGTKINGLEECSTTVSMALFSSNSTIMRERFLDLNILKVGNYNLFQTACMYLQNNKRSITDQSTNQSID